MLYYKPEDFICECGCGKAAVSPELVERLEELATRVGDAARIARGYYCEEFRDRMPGYGDSHHCEGTAVDVHVYGQYFRHKFLKEALQLFPIVVITPRYIHLEIGHAYHGDSCFVY